MPTNRIFTYATESHEQSHGYDCTCAQCSPLCPFCGCHCELPECKACGCELDLPEIDLDKLCRNSDSLEPLTEDCDDECK